MQCAKCGQWGKAYWRGHQYACKECVGTKPHCSWCSSAHVADTKCTCPEPCAVGWCAAGEEVLWI